MGDYGSDTQMRRDMGGPPGRSRAQNRATIQQLKLIGQSHPTGLTQNLLKLFEPRPPLEFKPLPEKPPCAPYSGIAQFVSQFSEPGDAEYSPPVTKAETPSQRRARIHNMRLEKGAQRAREELEKYDPGSDPNVEGDPFKTLFVARISYETTEHKIRREFEAYGPIKRIRLVHDRVSGKPRGYAFIEFHHTRDMKTAYKQADGRKIDNRRVLVDVERGRTVANWRPRRLGGGLGSTRVGGDEVNQRHTGREPPLITARDDDRPRDHDRGGFDRDRKFEGRGGDRERPGRRDYDRDYDRDRDDHSTRDRERDRHRDYHRERERDRGDYDREPREGRERERDYDREGGGREGRDRDSRDVRESREREGREGRDRDRDRRRSRSADRERERERDRR
ncbi:hypothetical protein CBR_g28042 [Chara braunii]|uniref:RRM domain-containing protein n=1 Tax=Chara braunii TaxID=69332 RepID=A0A388L957_CHABU|nr:hypothetical protein CBR_g28042 [Chara braunii]|eukprot:GBG78818.1 hypothetical protein CBR_g28042 [Chara braunii]